MEIRIKAGPLPIGAAALSALPTQPLQLRFGRRGPSANVRSYENRLSYGDDMTAFPTSILDYWHNAFAGSDSFTSKGLSFAVSETLSPKRPAMIIEMNDGTARAVVRPEVAERVAIDPVTTLSIADIWSQLAGAGVTLHDPDYLFYLPKEAQPVLDKTKNARQLGENDRVAFDNFHLETSEQDREDAFVELDHWTVVGCFDNGRLVSAASICLWDGSPAADLGVLTLPDARGKGFARAVVQSINVISMQRGYEPQYRCQLDNHPSVALAKTCGFALFGKWIVAADNAPQPIK